MRVPSLALLLGGIAGPALAAIQAPVRPRITFFWMILEASMISKLFMLGLVISMMAAAIICWLKLSGPQPTGSSAFISGLRIGGPLAGVLGAVYGAIQMLMGVANSGSVNLASMGPGIAEGLVTLFLGLLAGSLAILAHSLVNARIDRDLLKA